MPPNRDRARDRGGAGVRHRPPRDDPRLPAGARPAGAARLRAAARRRHRRRHRRARHGGGLGLAGAGGRRRHRSAGDRDGARERRGQRARRPGRLRHRGRLPPPAAAGGRALRPGLRQHPRRAAAAPGAASSPRTSAPGGVAVLSGHPARGRRRAWRRSTAAGATGAMDDGRGSASGRRWCCARRLSAQRAGERLRRLLGDLAAVQADVGELLVGQLAQRALGGAGVAPGGEGVDGALDERDDAEGGDGPERDRSGWTRRRTFSLSLSRGRSVRPRGRARISGCAPAPHNRDSCMPAMRFAQGRQTLPAAAIGADAGLGGCSGFVL